MWNSLIVMVGAGVLAVPLAASMPVAGQTASASVTLVATTAGPVSQTTADSLAVNAVGGGTVVHTSQDHYQGQPVYDIHVLYQSQTWDVKVGMNGTILQKQLSPEQPSSSGSTPSSNSTPPPSPSASGGSSNPSSVTESAAEQIALKVVGGGTVTHVSADHTAGVADWDIHITYGGKVWDVKVAMSNGQVLAKKLSNEQPSSSTSPSTSPSKAGESSKPPESSGSASDKHPAPTTMNGITFNQKLTTVPSQFSQDVTSATSAVNGVSVKWIKFQTKSHGDFQMNIKIRLAHGTTKVQDIFNASGQLVAQKLPHGK